MDIRNYLNLLNDVKDTFKVNFVFDGRRKNTSNNENGTIYLGEFDNEQDFICALFYELGNIGVQVLLTDRKIDDVNKNIISHILGSDLARKFGYNYAR